MSETTILLAIIAAVTEGNQYTAEETKDLVDHFRNLVKETYTLQSGSVTNLREVN